MTVLLKGGRPASQSAIDDLERELGFSLSAQYRAFLGSQDGAEPATRNFFRLPDDNGSSVRRFVPLSEIMNKRRTVEFLPRPGCPIAYDGLGNYLFMRPDDPAVYFRDHEVEDSAVKVADDFDEFLAMVEPFDDAKFEAELARVRRKQATDRGA